jgi:hypothetical protein
MTKPTLPRIETGVRNLDALLLMRKDRIEAMGARRVGVDTVSVFITIAGHGRARPRTKARRRT